MKYFCFALLTMMISFPAIALETVTVSVSNKSGEPVPNAVIVAADSVQDMTGVKFDWPNAMEQENIQFAPYVLVAPVGSEVSFPNRDRVRHHVYSFSKGNRFELKLYGREEARTVKFTSPGKVALGCNIHDGMIGYIRVVETVHAGKTDADGRFVFSELPAGVKAFQIWHPDMAEADDLLVPVGDGTDLSVVLDVPSASMSGHEH